MTLLFDIQPEEPTRKRARAKGGHPPKANEDIKKAPSYIGQTPPKAIKALGRIDHIHECADERCQGTAHDIVYEDAGNWLIQCCYCNTAQWVPLIAGHLKPQAEEFVFRDGRFAGRTISEALEEPRGRDYVTWASENHPRPAVREACKKHIDGLTHHV